MHPEIKKLFAGGGFRLGDFIGMMHIDVIRAAAMDIQLIV